MLSPPKRLKLKMMMLCVIVLEFKKLRIASVCTSFCITIKIAECQIFPNGGMLLDSVAFHKSRLFALKTKKRNARRRRTSAQHRARYLLDINHPIGETGTRRSIPLILSCALTDGYEHIVAPGHLEKFVLINGCHTIFFPWRLGLTRPHYDAHNRSPQIFFTFSIYGLAPTELLTLSWTGLFPPLNAPFQRLTRLVQSCHHY